MGPSSNDLVLPDVNHATQTSFSGFSTVQFNLEIWVAMSTSSYRAASTVGVPTGAIEISKCFL